jgi:hypothetical protein
VLVRAVGETANGGGAVMLILDDCFFSNPATGPRSGGGVAWSRRVVVKT